MITSTRDKEVEMKKQILTANEIKAMNYCLNYDSREEQLEDNYSNGDVKALKKILKWNEQQVGGLISSLEQKGMGYMDDKILWLTDLGINTIFDILES